MRQRKEMSANDIDRALNRIAHEIIEKNKGCDNLAIVGIRTRGVYLAYRLAKKIEQIENKKIPTGIIDITLYRDDLSNSAKQPEVKKTEIDFKVTGKGIIMLDDVLYTGRTIRAAIDALMDLGRPNFIYLGVLVDRGHRELPIQADFCGREIVTQKNEIIEVFLKESDSTDEVLVRDNSNNFHGKNE